MFGKLFGKFWREKANSSESLEDYIQEIDDEKEEDEEADTEPVGGFCETFGDVTIQTVNAKKKGLCLEATNGRGVKILMEAYENDIEDIPEGSNAYFFGNKLIVVTRWADMSDMEKQKVETAELALALHPYPCLQVSLKIDKNWGDVIVNLYHCYDGLNDENAPVDEVIFLFADMEDESYLSFRRVALPQFIQKFLQNCNVNSHKALPFDIYVPSIHLSAEDDPSQTFSDKFYDMCWELTQDFYNAARRADLDDIDDGIYIEINTANKVKKIYQND